MGSTGPWLVAAACLVSVWMPATRATADVLPQDRALQATTTRWQPRPGQTHEGLFMRVTFGAGGALAHEDAERRELTVGGFAWLLEASLGGAIAPDLILHGSLFSSAVTDPSVEQNREDVSDADALFTTSALGVGLSYYIMPVNMYLSGALGFGVATYEDRSGAGDSEPGPAVSLLVGKEWWVGPEWGMGVAGRLFLMSLPNVERLDVVGLGLVFSATYN